MENTIRRLRDFYNTDVTKDVDFRIKSLQKLYAVIVLHEQDIMDALKCDLHKSPFESYATEIGIVLGELQYQINHIRRWAKTRRLIMPLTFFPSKNLIIKEPYGVALIIAPWNYPFQLLINPLVSAIAAGNCVVLKTSPNAPATANMVERIVKETFSSNHVAVFHGNREVNRQLLALRFDYIFFTGSPVLGKVVMQAAAVNLTPVTLELGGKSPCIVDEDANISLAAKRIIWGKTLNSGQTCISPDFLMVHRSVKDALIMEMKKTVAQFFGDDPCQSPDYPRIITDHAMSRLVSYLSVGTVVMGGKYDLTLRYMEPTIIENVPMDAPIWQEEIFGPIFPLMVFDHIDEVVSYVKKHEKPLAFYYFTKNRRKANQVLCQTSSGGACINDTIIHIGNHKVPFGGVGNSGMGNYHGRYGFETFTHTRTVAISSSKIDIPLKYPPYEGKLDKVKRFLK